MEELYLEYLDYVCSNDLLNGNEFKIFYFLCRKSMQQSYNENIQISQKNIHEKTGISRPTVRKSLEKLSTCGLISYIQDRSKGKSARANISFSEKVNKYFSGKITIDQLREKTPTSVKNNSDIAKITDTTTCKESSTLSQDGREICKDSFLLTKSVIEKQSSNFIVRWKDSFHLFSDMEKSLHVENGRWKVSFHLNVSDKPPKINNLEENYKDLKREFAHLLKIYPPIYSRYYIRLIYIADYFMFGQNLIPFILKASKKEKLFTKSGYISKGFRLTEENEHIIPENLAKIDGFKELYNDWLDIQEFTHKKPVSEASRRQELKDLSKFSFSLDALKKAIKGEWKNLHDIDNKNNSEFSNSSSEKNNENNYNVKIV